MTDSSPGQAAVEVEHGRERVLIQPRFRVRHVGYEGVLLIVVHLLLRILVWQRRAELDGRDGRQIKVFGHNDIVRVGPQRLGRPARVPGIPELTRDVVSVDVLRYALGCWLIRALIDGQGSHGERLGRREWATVRRT